MPAEMPTTPAPPKARRGIVVVCGATGYLGHHVVRALHADGWRIRALARDPGRLSDVADLCHEVFVGQATDPSTLGGLFDGADAAFSSIGVRSLKRHPSLHEVDERANLTLVQGAEQAGVGSFSFVSLLHGDRMRDRSPLIAARERVVDQLRRSAMSETIIRPTGFFNDMAAFLAMARRGRVWLIGRDTTRINPIHGADLAPVVAEALAAPGTGERNVGGPDILTQAEVARLAFAALHRAPRVSSVPSWLVRAAGRAAGPYNANASGALQMFALMGEIDMIGEQVGEHHLADLYADLAAAAAPAG